MSDKKMFTAEEVARMILDKAHNTLKKHEETLKKSKNTAHEIDAGEEFNNDEAECPESLKGEGNSETSKNEPKKEKSSVAENEDSMMEDEPLSDDESEEDESEEDEYEFKKSQSGMHTVEYKKLKKFGSQGAPLGSNLGASIAAGIQGVKKDENSPEAKENPQYHIRATQEGKAPKKPWTTDTRRHIDYSRSGMKGAKLSSPEDQKRFESEAKERSKKFKEESKKQD